MSVTIGARYRHRKGGEYQVLAIALHSETHAALVVYQDGTGVTWARPWSMFTDGRFTLIEGSNA